MGSNSIIHIKQAGESDSNKRILIYDFTLFSKELCLVQYGIVGSIVFVFFKYQIST